MAASGSSSLWPLPSNLPRGLSTPSPEAQSISLHSVNERQGFSATFPTGQRSKDAFHKTSSFLLRQLIHRYRGLDAEVWDEDRDEFVVEAQDRKQADVESEESSESEMLNLEEEFDGVLREEVVAEALYKLGRSGCGTEQVYLNLSLSGCDLIDVSILHGYVHLQKLDLSVNKIEDLSCVSYMPYLVELNASQNKLTTFFHFKPPQNLKRVDFSYNQIPEMCDLSAYQALTKLILDSNEIEEIKGLELCSNLTHLSLAKNKIKTIDGLSTLPIKILHLSSNRIEKITGLEELGALQTLDLSHNQISSLQGLENHDLLEVLNLEDNKIAELREIEYIEDLPLLRVLNLLGNPIQEKSDYWFFVIFKLLRLTELDHKKIKVEEKVSAVNKYGPPPEVIAARDHLTHVVNSMMQPQRIFDSTLPSLDAPYPMLILAGPQACGKRELAHRLCRQFSTYFRYGEDCALLTALPSRWLEQSLTAYQRPYLQPVVPVVAYFRRKESGGDKRFFFSFPQASGSGLLVITSLALLQVEAGVRSLKYSYFEPRYILVVPMNKTKYEGYLRRKGLFSRAEIECAVSRVDLYIKINQKYPGYFDAVINTDDLEVAYQRLSQLIRGYLGLTEEPAKGLAPTTAGAPSSKKTLSGVPAHLVPSPRRLAKLEADGQITEQLSGIQIHPESPESQPLAPTQNQEPTQEEETCEEKLSPSHPPEPPQQLSSSGPEIPPQAQDLAPNQKEGDVQQSGLSPKPLTTDVPDNEVPSSKVKASEVGLSSPTPPQDPPQPDHDEESGEAKVTSTRPPPSPGDSHKPLNEEAPKAEDVRVSTPYPELPHPQGSSTGEKQTQDRDDPGTLLPRSRLAPTRLPQPQTLAPLQSRRPTPKLLSPSREEAPAAGSSPSLGPSPRPGPAQEGEASKLPPINPPQPKAPHNPSPSRAHGPQSAQEERAGGVKLPLISPPIQEHVSQHSLQAPQDEEAQKDKLPHIVAPSSEPQLAQDTGAWQNARPAKEKKDSKVDSISSRKIPESLASPQSQEPTGPRKKKLPIQRETGNESAHLKKGLPRGWQTALQLESHRKSTPAKVPSRHNPSPRRTSQDDERREVLASSDAAGPALGEALLPKGGQPQEEQSEKAHYPERVSLQRQHERAWQALMGKTPPDHTLLFQRGPVPVPEPIISDLRYFTQLGEPQKGFEFYDDYVVTPFGSYSEKSSKDTCDADKYSGFSESQSRSKERLYSEGSISSRPGLGMIGSEGAQALKGLSKASISHERGTLQGRKSVVPVISVICRPGFNVKPTLPPIPQGRK
ncbi:leucine-rich repeat and guanylate kinase domain-containing protein [Orycteropus afer afer]|uniref:Leucine-rich repeat and guanylate kinase domain-containing protein n=1 Tax=Orycteropus afer afer TaxID=1230840 RepID=A0AC54ZA88_ORYAF|nr:leucine-rich repeat and guanylate kinase domain-containing protein [Orycteropus afer afer]